MVAVATAPHVYWIVSRAAGTAALVLSSASVGLGVAMGGRLVRGRTPDLRVAHEALSLATMVALLVHGLSLLGDGFLHLGLADVTVPFASSYDTLRMTLGIAGGWMLVALGLSYYARRRIGSERWKRLHRWTLLAWLLGLGHAVAMGTDAGTAWFLVSAGAVALPAAALAGVRFSGTSQGSLRSR